MLQCSSCHGGDDIDTRRNAAATGPDPVAEIRTTLGRLSGRILLVAGLAATLLSAPAFAYSGEVYTVCRKPAGNDVLALRSCAARNCELRMRLRPGTFLWTEEPKSENGWRAVIVMININDEYPVNRPRGYVFDRYICKVEFRQ